MTIQVKSLDLCNSCIQKNNLPPCGVTSFYKGGKLIDISKGNVSLSKLQNYILCPVDAVKPFKEGVKFLNDKCIKCGLCQENCPYDNIDIEGIVSEKEVFEYLTTNILQIVSFLRSKLSSEYEVLTEVKALGNARDKRIDIVIKSPKKLYILKLLSRLSSLGKYERSYTSMILDSEDIQTEVEAIFLYCDEVNVLEASIKKLNEKQVMFTHISIENLITYFERGI